MDRIKRLFAGGGVACCLAIAGAWAAPTWAEDPSPIKSLETAARARLAEAPVPKVGDAVAAVAPAAAGPRGRAPRVLCGGRAQFRGEPDPDDCDLARDRLCYEGAAEDAARAIQAGLAQGFWNYDELWAERPRVRAGALVIDIVDGPNERRVAREIPRCPQR